MIIKVWLSQIRALRAESDEIWSQLHSSKFKGRVFNNILCKKDLKHANLLNSNSDIVKMNILIQLYLGTCARNLQTSV